MSLADQQWCPTSVQVTVLQARGLRVKGKSGTNDAYALMQVGKEKFQTSVVEKTVAPVWKEEATFDLPPVLQGGGGGPERCMLHVHVQHRALVGPDKQLGQAAINLLQLSEDTTRNKTEWFKLLDKTGKADKDRGEVLLDIQFMKNNMTASMFDLSTAGKSRSRLGKFKDKVRGKKKESELPVVPSLTQVLTDSEEEEAANEDAEGKEGKGKDKKSKKLKMKSLFAPKSNLQRNLSQSMSVLPAKNSSLNGSQSSGLNVESSEGKKKFKFSMHKRSGSSSNKDVLSGNQKQTPAEQSNLCINGSHVYCEEPPPRTSRIGSNFSLASSGHGSMEDVPESSPPSVDSLEAVKEYSPWMEEGEEDEGEDQHVKDGVDESNEEEERIKMEEERRRKEEALRRQEEMERLAEEKLRREEEERIKVQREEERKREEELEKMRQEEERVEREEEERIQREKLKLEEEERRKREEEQKLLEQKVKLKEEEKRKLQEEIIRREEEKALEKKREEEKALEKREEEKALEKREEEKALEKREEEKALEKREEEKALEKKREEEKALEKKREEEKALEKRDEEKALEKREEEEALEKNREEEEALEKNREEEEALEKNRKEEEALEKKREEEYRLAEENRLKEESIKREKERAEKERRQQEELMKKQEEEKREEERLKKEEMKRLEEEKARREKEEYERLMEEKRMEEEKIRLEEEKERIEEEKRVKEQEERRKKEEEMLRRQRLAEKLRQEEEERRVKAEKAKREAEEELRREEEERIKKEQIKRDEEKRRREEEERARKEKEENERRAEEMRLKEEEKRKEDEERVKERAERERKEEARKLEKEIKTNQEQRAAEKTSKISEPGEITSNPFEDFSPEDIPTSPPEPHGLPDKDETIQRCQSEVSSARSGAVSADEKDLIKTQWEKRPAPQPPGRNPSETQRQNKEEEEDASTRHLSQVNKQSKEKDVKTVSVPPQRSVQMIAPLNRSPEVLKNAPSEPLNNHTKATKHGKRAAPSRPEGDEPPSKPPRDVYEMKLLRAPRSLNPFDDEDEITDDATARRPPAGSLTANKDDASQAKIKSSKVARAPAPPGPSEAQYDKGDTQPRVKGHVQVQESPNKETEQNKMVAGVKEEGPPVNSRRLLTVKPLNPLEQQQPIALVQEENNKSTGSVFAGDQQNSKVEAVITGPYSQLTQEELISLVLKQEKQLSERDKKISELERYIDNLLVRVIEEQPSILMSLSALK